jgi:hypothetical protein
MVLHELAPVGRRPGGGDTGGGSSGSPRCMRIFQIGPGSVMNAIGRMSTSQLGHCGTVLAVLTIAGLNAGDPAGIGHVSKFGNTSKREALGGSQTQPDGLGSMARDMRGSGGSSVANLDSRNPQIGSFFCPLCEEAGRAGKTGCALGSHCGATTNDQFRGFFGTCETVSPELSNPRVAGSSPAGRSCFSGFGDGPPETRTTVPHGPYD